MKYLRQVLLALILQVVYFTSTEPSNLMIILQSMCQWLFVLNTLMGYLNFRGTNFLEVKNSHNFLDLFSRMRLISRNITGKILANREL